jgi:hypothetical protein
VTVGSSPVRGRARRHSTAPLRARDAAGETSFDRRESGAAEGAVLTTNTDLPEPPHVGGRRLAAVLAILVLTALLVIPVATFLVGALS